MQRRGLSNRAPSGRRGRRSIIMEAKNYDAPCSVRKVYSTLQYSPPFYTLAHYTNIYTGAPLAVKGLKHTRESVVGKSSACSSAPKPSAKLMTRASRPPARSARSTSSTAATF